MSNATRPVPAGRGGLIPHLVCDRCADALQFYKRAFGALVDDFPEFSGGKASSPKALNGTPVTIHRYVDDCDAAIERAAKAGATVLMPPQDMFWGDRYGVVTDPFGHHWSFGTHLKDLTPAELQAAMSEAFAQHS